MDNSNQTLFALLPISLIGSILNWAIFIAVHNLKSFNHSFGYLSANQAIADALHSTTFLLYFCPMVLLDQPLFKQFSYHCGFILLFCYELSVMIHLIISLNRFCAVWAPTSYANVFSDRNTKMIIAGVWIFTALAALLFYQKLCHFYYDEQIHFLTFTSSHLCGFIGWYGDFLKNSAIVALVMMTDVLTVLKVRKMARKVAGNVSGEAQERMSHREMRFLKQTVTQGIFFMLELLTYFFIPHYFQNKSIVFFGTSFAWVAVHAIDGLVVVAFNPDVRQYWLCKGSKQIGTSTQATRVHNLAES